MHILATVYPLHTDLESKNIIFSCLDQQTSDCLLDRYTLYFVLVGITETTIMLECVIVYLPSYVIEHDDRLLRELERKKRTTREMAVLPDSQSKHPPHCDV